MEVERIFSAEQIKIHPELPKIIKDYTKAVIRAYPENVIEFSYNYFKNRVEASEKKLVDSIMKEEEATLKAETEIET